MGPQEPSQQAWPPSLREEDATLGTALSGPFLPPGNDEETAGQREKLERPNSDASFNLKNKVLDGNSLAVQWLRLPAFTAKGMGSIADGELRSCKPHG